MDRVQLDHLLLDVDFMHKPTIVGFRRKFGWASVTWLIEIYCQMSRASNALVTRDVMLAVCEDMRLDGGNEMIDYCIDHGLIIQLEDRADSLFTNSRVIKDQESLAKKRLGSKDRQEKFRNKDVTQRVCNASSNALQTRLPVTDPVTDLDINIKELDTPEIRKALSMFASKLESQNRPLNQITLDPMLMRYAGRPQEFLSALLYSASLTKCVNLIESPTSERAAFNGQRKNKSVEAGLALIKKYEAEEQAR